MNIQTPSSKPTLLLTGANGLLGQKLVAQLIEENTFNIVATARGACRLPKQWTGYTYVQMDITDPARINHIFLQYPPDVAIHCACMTNVDLCETEQNACYKQNVEAVRFIVSACEKYQTRLIYLSTDFIFDGEKGPYLEDDKPNPLNYYGQTKLESEKIIKNSAIEWVIVRTGLVYGISYDMSRSNIVLWVKNSIEEGKELRLVDDQFRTPTLAEDLAGACITIAVKKVKGIFNISGNEFLTPYDMGMETARYFKLPTSKIKKSDSSTFSQRAKRPLKTGFIIDKAKKELGYTPHSFKEGIALLAKQIKFSLTT